MKENFPIKFIGHIGYVLDLMSCYGSIIVKVVNQDRTPGGENFKGDDKGNNT